MNLVKVLIDVILVLIVLLGIWRGYKGGIIATVCTAAALLVSLVAGNIVATVYSGEFEGALETFAGGMIDTAVAETLDFNGFDKDGWPDDRYPILSAEEKTDVYTVSFQTLRRIGVSDGVAEKIAEETAEEIDIVGRDMRIAVTEKLCGQAAFAAAFIIVALLIAIIFAAIGNIINLSFTIPGAQVVNGIIGAAIGCVNSIVIVLFVTCIFRYSGILIGKSVIESTKIASWLMDSNMIANIFGI